MYEGPEKAGTATGQEGNLSGVWVEVWGMKKYKIGDRVWVVKPPVYGGGFPCIKRWYPRWGKIVAIGYSLLEIRTGPRNIWWYHPEDIEDPFLTICKKALK